jgi:hypothetical protein
VISLCPPPPLLLAHELAPLLTELNWGIGGSLLLHNLKLVTNVQDLDIVTTPQDFPDLQKRLLVILGPPSQIDHPTYASTHFSRFKSPQSVTVDVIAGIRVRTSTGFKSWDFNPRTLFMANGLPWMRPQDWLDLYEMFDRPERVTLLRVYLNGKLA